MNSESGKKSMDELVHQARQQAQTAGKVIPCVTVTEANWAGLLHLLQIHLQLLQEEGKQLEALATEEQLVSFMNRQLEILQEDGTAAREDALQFREKLLQEMKDFNSRMEKTVEIFSAQAGNMSGKFGSSLSEAQQKIKKFTVRAFWISLIPSAIFLLSEVLLHCFLPL